MGRNQNRITDTEVRKVMEEKRKKRKRKPKAEKKKERKLKVEEEKEDEEIRQKDRRKGSSKVTSAHTKNIELPLLLLCGGREISFTC